MSKIVISPEQYQDIVSLYNAGTPQVEIESIYGVSHGVVRRVLQRCGVELRNPSHKRRLYEVNESYFDVIDSPNKAYILGLLYADGCNAPYRNTIKLCLQEKDSYILEEIKEEIGSSHPIAVRHLSDCGNNHQDSYELCITNKHMSETLASLGMVQAKSLVLEFPYWLDDALRRHFIRGYCDGDGNVRDSGTYVSICSTYDVCQSINMISQSMGIKSNIRRVASKSDATWIFYICNRSGALRFMDYMYDDATLFLKRKHDVYLRLRNKYDLTA